MISSLVIGSMMMTVKIFRCVIALGGNQKREAIRELSLGWRGGIAACSHSQMHSLLNVSQLVMYQLHPLQYASTVKCSHYR